MKRTQNFDGLRLLYLGRLHPKKGLENLLDGFRKLNGISANLIIAGKGEDAYAAELKARVINLELEDRVQMVGEVHDERKKALLTSADCMIIPSHTENFALVVAEALAHGMPVIASKGTPWKGLDENDCGLWVNNDPESLAAAIKRIAEMPRTEMGKRGREWMQREFSLAAMADRMISVYRSLIARD